MTERDFVENLAYLLTRGLIELDDADGGNDDQGPRFRPTPAGLEEIADPAMYDITNDPRD